MERGSWKKNGKTDQSKNEGGNREWRAEVREKRPHYMPKWLHHGLSSPH